MTQLTILPLLVPLVTAVTSIILRKTRFKDYFSLAGSVAYLLLIIFVTNRVLTSGAITYQAGGWPAPYGITFIVDSLSLFMLLITAIVSLAANIYSWSYIEDKGKESGYYAFFHFMVAGMSGAFTTGDLFNLFVMLEIVLMSSYAMVAYTGSKESLFTSLKYVVLNLIGSSLMLVAIGGLYSVTGTLNMADMALILSKETVNTVPVLGLTMMLFSVFAIKSGLVPFHFWAPPVYSNSPPPAAAMMAGISKKVGIYAVIRLYITVFSQASMPQNAILFAGKSLGVVTGHIVLAFGALTLIVGAISAINRREMDKMLSYSSIGQVGFIFVPVAFAMIYGSESALAASLAYLLCHSLAKPALFMISGIIQQVTGTVNLEDIGGLSEKSFALSAAYFVSAFSLVGIPPLLGFFGKMLVFKSAVVNQSFGVLILLLTGAVASLVYFGKAWLEIFFGEPEEFDYSKFSSLQTFAVMILVVLILSTGINFEPVYQLASEAAETAFETSLYIDYILGDLE